MRFASRNLLNIQTQPMSGLIARKNNSLPIGKPSHIRMIDLVVRERLLLARARRQQIILHGRSGQTADGPFQIRRESKGSAVAQAYRWRSVLFAHVGGIVITAGFARFGEEQSGSVRRKIARSRPIEP